MVAGNQSQEKNQNQRISNNNLNIHEMKYINGLWIGVYLLLQLYQHKRWRFREYINGAFRFYTGSQKN